MSNETYNRLKKLSCKTLKTTNLGRGFLYWYRCRKCQKFMSGQGCI